jgi:hypothetical protein
MAWCINSTTEHATVLPWNTTPPTVHAFPCALCSLVNRVGCDMRRVVACIDLQPGCARMCHSCHLFAVLGQQDNRRGSLLPSGPSGWLRKSKGNLKQSGTRSCMANQ